MAGQAVRMAKTGFAGFPREAIQFFKSLERNNRREWFQPRKPIYDEQVKAPMAELIHALTAEFTISCVRRKGWSRQIRNAFSDVSAACWQWNMQSSVSAGSRVSAISAPQILAAFLDPSQRFLDAPIVMDTCP